AKSMLAQMPEASQDILDVSFKQNFEACKPSFGYGCTFYKLCHPTPEQEGKAPLELGYQKRVPHHQPELDRWTSPELTTDSE
ncbi:MAG: hypothetical protein LC723_14330, partial [Actinobacteria bacterium]|nr:hypothetical protein [Actinomycetota bacterium]